MLLYEFAVIRFVPKVEREEFINVGLLVFCKEQKQLRVRIHLDETKWHCFSTEISKDVLIDHLTSFENVARGGAAYGPIGLLDAAERFRWLSAVKSSCIQVSRPHPGLALDIEVEFNKLFENLVL